MSSPQRPKQREEILRGLGLAILITPLPFALWAGFGTWNRPEGAYGATYLFLGLFVGVPLAAIALILWFFAIALPVMLILKLLKCLYRTPFILCCLVFTPVLVCLVSGYLPAAEWSDWCGASSPAGGLICAALWGTYVAAAGSICIAWRGIPSNEAAQPRGSAGGRAGG
jgi:hypothetical protein